MPGSSASSSSSSSSSKSSSSSSSDSCPVLAGSSTNYSNVSKSQPPQDSGETSGSDPLERIACVDQFEAVAKSKLDRTTFEYFANGADDELTLARNKSALRTTLTLQSRVLCNVSQMDLTRYVFGDKLSMPIGVSPTAMHKMLHPDGELAMVRACKDLNALMILSMFSTTSLEDVAREAPTCTKWQNLYILKSRNTTKQLAERAIRYGYRALVVTCDAPTLGNRRRDKINGFTLGEHTLENIKDNEIMELRDHSATIFDPSITWQDLADLKKLVGSTVRVIAKGIMCPEDAELALEAGVDGIMVSNHGGRQLDSASSTIEVLEDIVARVDHRCPVFIDGGFRTGGDVLKALALGADMVFVGRPAAWGLASFGERGARAALAMLRDELSRAMMLCGCSKLADISPRLLARRRAL